MSPERILEIPTQHDGALWGVLSDAADRCADHCVVLINAGIVHRVGPHRLYVSLARALAGAGIPAARIDLSGLGDSPVARAGPGHEAQGVADIRATIDSLQAGGIKTVALAGLCSGADHAFRAAQVDERVTGLIQLDPYAYDSLRARVDRLAAKATDPGRWRRALTRLTATPEPEGGDSLTLTDRFGRPHPPRQEVAAGYGQLAYRGVQMLALYSRFVREVMTAPRHFWDVFGDVDWQGCMMVEVNSHADHTYTEYQGRLLLIQQIVNWHADWLKCRDAAKVPHAVGGRR